MKFLLVIIFSTQIYAVSITMISQETMRLLKIANELEKENKKLKDKIKYLEHRNMKLVDLIKSKLPEENVYDEWKPRRERDNAIKKFKIQLSDKK